MGYGINSYRGLRSKLWWSALKLYEKSPSRDIARFIIFQFNIYKLYKIKIHCKMYKIFKNKHITYRYTGGDHKL